MLNHMKNLSVSFFITAKLDAQGQYNNEKIKKDTALARLKLTTLVAVTKLNDKAFKLDALLQIEIVDTINSFAIIPTINAHTTPAFFKPIGTNINVILSAMQNKTLLVIISVY